MRGGGPTLGFRWEAEGLSGEGRGRARRTTRLREEIVEERSVLVQAMGWLRRGRESVGCRGGI